MLTMLAVNKTICHSATHISQLRMDSEVERDGRLLDIVDKEWREDRLPFEDIVVPQMELPELEPDNGNTTETLSEQEQKWTDLALQTLQERHSLDHNTAPSS